MPEGITVECLMNNIMDTISDNVSKQKNVSIFEEKSNSMTSQFNRLFGCQKPVHHILGGGKSADVLLWRNKKISASVLTGATVIWVLFEWLNYHFLTILCFGIVIGILGQFVWKNALAILNGRSPSKVPRIVLPEEVFVNCGKLIGVEANRCLSFLQDVACRGNMKQFLVVVAGLWALAIIGSWCNFLTVLYIGFVAAHTLPVLYERYDNQVDGFVNKVIEQLQHNYRKLDAGVLSRIPKGNLRGKKVE